MKKVILGTAVAIMLVVMIAWIFIQRDNSIASSTEIVNNTYIKFYDTNDKPLEIKVDSVVTNFKDKTITCYRQGKVTYRASLED